MTNKTLRIVGDFLIFSDKDCFQKCDNSDSFMAININHIISIKRTNFLFNKQEGVEESQIAVIGDSFLVYLSPDEIIEAIETSKKNQETNLHPAPDIHLKYTYRNGQRCASVIANGESVFSTDSNYEAHMFMEELKAKLSTKV